jgi:hypothetical protein
VGELARREQDDDEAEDDDEELLRHGTTVGTVRQASISHLKRVL